MIYTIWNFLYISCILSLHISFPLPAPLPPLLPYTYPPGWLLGPIIFGSVIDGICTIWDVTSPGVRGRCLLYDNDVFKMKLHGYSSLSLLFSNAALLFGYLYARCTGCLDDPPTDDLAKCGDQGQSQGQGQGLNKDQYQKEQAEINGESLKKSVDYSKGDANSDVEIVKEKPESI